MGTFGDIFLATRLERNVYLQRWAVAASPHQPYAMKSMYYGQTWGVIWVNLNLLNAKLLLI